MDIEDFDTEDLKDEILKCVDEYLNRGYSMEDVEDLIRNGERKK